MTDLQTLKISVELIKVLEGSSQKEVGNKIGYTNESSFSQVVNGKVPMPNGILDKLAQMNSNVKKFISAINMNEDDYIVKTETDNGVISGLRKFNPSSSELIPYYSADFMAGNSDVQYDDGTRHPDYYMDIPEFYGCTAFRALGDSMENIIKSSSVLFGIKLDDDWRESLEYGQIYGVVMKNGRRYLKYIRKYKDDPKNYFSLESENVKYDQFEVKKDKIKNLWLIQGWMDKRAS
ncbi:S24 family peptidase [Pedobacter metabolipauper]|uniref:Peptidase S24/S26A/S26B/S26C domain-containing protein n=1 Tax=Pedobacter metabolipauper TaxID=425513 RepID=A0A4R6T3A2_9SPHI|nr:S24 family peptidase [Pedobacter metabolipauper]TDQ12800.1 hypothetical protein ATK78_0007 [Pedobacter metabolipauper]